MLWALLRLSVRDAQSQLRYGRFGGPGRLWGRIWAAGVHGARAGRPGRTAVLPGRSGAASHVRMVLGRDRVRGRSPKAISPMIKIALALYPALISRNMHHAGTLRHSRFVRPGRAGKGRTARGRPPGRSADSTSVRIRSPCHRRRRARRGPGSSPASPRSRPRW